MNILLPKNIGSSEWLTEKSDESPYFNKIRIRIGVLESKFIKFYKLDQTQNYSYPNETNSRIVKCKVDGIYLGDSTHE